MSESTTTESANGEDLYTASQWQLMARKFAKHRLAVWSGLTVLALYMSALFCDFLSPYGLEDQHIDYIYAPPQRLHWIGPDGVHLVPFVYGIKGMRHPETLRKVYAEDRTQVYPLRFFARGTPYRFLGLFETDRHFIGVDRGGTLFLLGTDSLGRDLLTRILYGARISLTVGLIGVALSFVFGLSIGAVSGYYGGWIDNLIQRLIEILRSFPSIPLWMALSAALPSTWSPRRSTLALPSSSLSRLDRPAASSAAKYLPCAKKTTRRRRSSWVQANDASWDDTFFRASRAI